jgi:hypothetical protein
MRPGEQPPEVGGGGRMEDPTRLTAVRRWNEQGRR